MSIELAQVPPIVDRKYKLLEAKDDKQHIEIHVRFDGVAAVYITQIWFPLPLWSTSSEEARKKYLTQIALEQFRLNPPARQDWRKPGAAATKRKIQKMRKGA